MVDVISLNVFLLYIWFQTDFFPYYFKKIDYFNYLEEGIFISYPDYLFINNPNFWTKLFSCPTCLLFWIHFFLSFWFGFNLFFFNYLLSLVIYKLICRIMQS